MKEMRQCENGHYWDPSIYPACPACSGLTNRGDKLSRVPNAAQKDIAGGIPTESPYVTAPPTNKTTPLNKPTPIGSTVPILMETTVPAPFFSQEITDILTPKPADIQPVVGWLVCVEGPYRGKSFEIHPGSNSIGRDEKARIQLNLDDQISKHNHALIAYDQRNNHFFLRNGENLNNIYLNENLLTDAIELKPYDCIDFGQSIMRFVPFCCEQFSWKDESAEKKEP